MCVCEQFAVAKTYIEKTNVWADAEARAQLDEAVVLEVDEVRDSTAAPPCSPLDLPSCVCVCVCVRRANGHCFILRQAWGDWR